MKDFQTLTASFRAYSRDVRLVSALAWQEVILSKFQEATKTGYRQKLSESYEAQGLFDLSDLHLQRSVFHTLPFGWRKSLLPLENLATAAQDVSSVRQAMQEGMSALPSNIGIVLGEGGVRNRLARRIRDIDPQTAREINPRIREADAVEFYLIGNYEHDLRRITIFAEFADKSRPGAFTATPRANVINAYLHEAAHGFDYLAGKLSDHPAVQKAYAEDLAALPGKVVNIAGADRKTIRASDFAVCQLSYYLPKENGGLHSVKIAREEAFAQVFAEKTYKTNLGTALVYEGLAKVWDRILVSLDAEIARPVSSLRDVKQGIVRPLTL